jgi:hypothetical protein
MAGNPILAEVSDKFGARMIRMPVGFYGLGQTSDLMRTWKAWYSLSRMPAGFALNREISVCVRLRGGAERTRTSNQAVMSRHRVPLLAALVRQGNMTHSPVLLS